MRPTDVLYQLYGGKRGDEVLDIIGKWTRGMSEFKRDRPVSKSNRIEDYDYNTKAATTTDDGWWLPRTRPSTGTGLPCHAQLWEITPTLLTGHSPCRCQGGSQ